MSPFFLGELLERCNNVDKTRWIAIASDLPHVTVRATDEEIRDFLFGLITIDDTFSVTKHHDTDLRVWVD